MPGEEKSFSYKHMEKILRCYNERGLPTKSKITKEDVQMDTNSLAHTKWKCKYHLVFA